MELKGRVNKVTRCISRYWLPILLVMILLAIFWGWFMPGPRFSEDLPYYTEHYLQGFFGAPYSWEPAVELGINHIYDLCGYPRKFALGLLASLGVPFSVSEQLVLFFPALLLAVLSAYYLGRTLFKSRKASLVTAAVFVINSFFLAAILRWPGYATSVALAPLTLALFIRAKREPGFRYPVLAGLALWLQTVQDIRFCYLALMIVLIGWLLVSLGALRRGREGLRDILRWSGRISLSLVVLIGMSLYWLMPILFGSGLMTPGNLTESWWIPILSWNSLINGLTFLESFWLGGRMVDAHLTSISPLFAIFPIVGLGTIFASVAGKKRDRSRITIALAGGALVLVGAFLAKGSNPPMGNLYVWLFEHLPGFSMMRVPNKMFLLISLGYSILFGLGVVLISDLAKSGYLSRRTSSLLDKRNQFPVEVTSFIIVIMLFLSVLPTMFT